MLLVTVIKYESDSGRMNLGDLLLLSCLVGLTPEVKFDNVDVTV